MATVVRKSPSSSADAGCAAKVRVIAANRAGESAPGEAVEVQASALANVA
jgi:hypothetical protein